MYCKKIFPVVISIFILLLGAGCGSYKPINAELTDSLPSTYIRSQDTVNTALQPARVFYSDKYLLRLIDTAWNGNPDLQAAFQRIEMAGASLRYSRSLLLPTVDFNANAGIERYGKYTQNGVGNFDTNFSPNISPDQRIPDPVPDYFVGFRSSWEIDIWGKLRNNKKAAVARLWATEQSFRFIKTELAATIAQRYYELLALDIETSVIQRNIKLQENALEIVRIQKEGGRATELAVQQFDAQLSRTRGLAYTTAQQVAEMENQLRLLTGKFQGEIPRDTSIMALKLPAYIHTGVPAQMLMNRPDVREVENELLAMNADIRSARAAFFPSVTITPYAGFNAFATAVLFNPQSAVFGIIGGVTAPVLNRKRIKANYRSKIAEGRIALAKYQKTVLTGYQEVMDGLNGMENYRKYYDQKKKEVTALRNAVQVSNELYLVGRANYLEIITAQRNVLDAELELAVAKKNIYLNAVNLYKALGGGWR